MKPFGRSRSGEVPHAQAATTNEESIEWDCPARTRLGRTFRSPADALAWQEARGNRAVAIPVYDVNGKEVIGKFVIGGRDGPMVEVPNEAAR